MYFLNLNTFITKQKVTLDTQILSYTIDEAFRRQTRSLFRFLQSSVFERDDVALPRVASFFHQEALKQQQEAEAMLGYLAERGGNYCGKDVQVSPAGALYSNSSLYFLFFFSSSCVNA